MTLQRTLLWWLALIACWCLAACGSGAGDKVADASVRIHVMAAPQGQLVPLATAPGAATAWTLVLRNPYPQAIWGSPRFQCNK